MFSNKYRTVIYWKC